MLTVYYRKFLFIVSIAAVLVAKGALGCSQINEFVDINHAIQSSTYKVVLLCPFSVTHNADNDAFPLSIINDGIKLICAKSKVDDECVIEGDAKHFDIKANGVTVLGLNFKGSKDTAVSIHGVVGTSFIDCNFTENQKTVGNGGAIETQMNLNENVMVFGSSFDGNSAGSGGGIYGGGISIISSKFTNNSANETDGGAAFIGAGYIESSMFTLNNAMINGPAVYSNDHVCSMGLNHACHSFDYQENTCDGIFSTNERCTKFASSCEYSSATPTVMPSMEPSLGPSLSSKPSQEPSSAPTLSVSPSREPSMSPSAIFSERPSISMLPTNAPTHIPTTSQVPSSSPTSMPSSKPTLSTQPTVTCNMGAEQRSNMLMHMVLGTKSSGEENEVLDWLLFHDEYNLCPQADNVLQRYTAAIVSRELFPERTLNSDHECSWLGFVCNLKSQIIAIKHNGLSSDVPVELSLLEHLEEIIIQKGSMKGSLPINMFTVPSLKHIDLDKNELSGIIEVDGESSVQRLDINFNKFSGSIDFLTSFPNITEAHLDNNSFNGTIPASLGDLTNLHILTLHRNSLSGTMPESICNLRTNHNLKYLMADCDVVECHCCTHCTPYRK